MTQWFYQFTVSKEVKINNLYLEIFDHATSFGLNVFKKAHDINNHFFKLSHGLLLIDFSIQHNLHETDLLFRYLSHHLTWHCSSISEDLQHLLTKLFLLLFL